MTAYRVHARALFATFVAVAITFASPAPTRAVDDAKWMFDPAVMVQVSLTIPDSSMEQISCDMGAERPYVPATFTMTYAQRGKPTKTYGPSAITLKVKGQYGSFRCLPEGQKAGLKLKFPSGARPDGLKKLTLNNMVQDGSMVSEVLSYEVFRSLGVAAPRTGYAQVAINGTYRGIFLNVETLDSVALPRWYPTTQHLYEGSYGSWWGDTGDAFSGHYEVDEGAEGVRSDLQGLLDTARNHADGWYARMHPIADLDQMTKMWAAEWFLGHWDGYSQFITNNYYLHADSSGRFTMMPWGTDQAFQWAERYNGSGDHHLFNGCVADPICSGMYVDALAFIESKWKGWKLDRRADSVYRIVAAESTGVAPIKEFVAARDDEHREWVATLPRTPSNVSASTVRNRAGEIRVTWKRPSLAVPITGYAVEYRSGTGAWTRVTTASSSTSHTLTGLSAGRYSVRVRSLSDGLQSPSATKTVTVR
ncbi:MAG: hypothetical protein RL254_1113 [Planctomycetota bacterium]